MAHTCKECDGARRDGVSRRDVLRTSIGGFLGFAMARQADLWGAPRPEWLLPQGTTRAKGKSLIILWMAGGPSQFETFDPKEGRPNGGPTKAVETSAKGVSYAEHLPRVATQAHHIAVLRSITSKEGSHERGRYLLHTGYVPSGTVTHPALGSITAMEIGNKGQDLPNYIALGGASWGAGFLPPEYDPFLLAGRGGGRRGGDGLIGRVPNISGPPGVDKRRFRARMELLQTQEDDWAKDRATEEYVRHKTAYDKADRLMHTPLLEAFDLSKEKPELAKEYGEGVFGKGCLLARRLVERGVACVEVQLGGWDTHQDNFKRVAQNCGQLDPAMGTLIRDLHDRRLLESTLVVWMGEFGRTPRVNPQNGRDHYPRAWTAALAGGGIHGGRVIGETDKDGVEVLNRPVTVPDLMATIYTALGVDIRKKNISPLGRPIQIVDNGVPVQEILG